MFAGTMNISGVGVDFRGFLKYKKIGDFQAENGILFVANLNSPRRADKSECPDQNDREYV